MDAPPPEAPAKPRSLFLTLRVSAETFARLDALAARRGASRHRTARIALRRGVDLLTRHADALEASDPSPPPEAA